MSDEKLTPERAIRLLRAKGAELESMVPSYLAEIPMVHPAHVSQDIRKLYEMAGNTLADIALIAQLLADHIERCTAVGVATAEALRLIAEMPDDVEGRLR